MKYKKFGVTSIMSYDEMSRMEKNEESQDAYKNNNENFSLT